MQDCPLEGRLEVRSTLDWLAQQVETWPAKDSYGSMVLLAVPSRSHRHHCDGQTKGRSVAQIPDLCRRVDLSGGWPPFAGVDSSLLLDWVPCVEEATAPFHAHESCLWGPCWSRVRGTATWELTQALWPLCRLRERLCWGAR